MIGDTQLEVVHEAPSAREMREFALVLRSAGIAHQAQHFDGRWFLLVDGEDADRARKELASYARENAGSELELTKESDPVFAGAWWGMLVYAIILGAVEAARRADLFGADWFAAGSADASAIQNGEWWRCATALTLHGDLAHLVGNIVIGGLFGLFVAQAMGPGLGWSMILLTGIAGNLLNAMGHTTAHRSIGASTAVFGALGILAGAMLRRSQRQKATLRRFAPLIGGAVLLGFLGTSGERTDVGAHVAGFAAGLAIGTVQTAIVRTFLRRGPGQLICGAIAIAVITAAWALALGDR